MTSAIREASDLLCLTTFATILTTAPRNVVSSRCLAFARSSYIAPLYQDCAYAYLVVTTMRMATISLPGPMQGTVELHDCDGVARLRFMGPHRWEPQALDLVRTKTLQKVAG